MVSMITICEIIHHQLQKDSQALCSEMSQQNSVVPNQNYHKCSYFLSVNFTFYLCVFNWLESQSRPSYSPSPLVAQVAWMYQFLFRRE